MPLSVIELYTYYHGIIDHNGCRLQSLLVATMTARPYISW